MFEAPVVLRLSGRKTSIVSEFICRVLNGSFLKSVFDTYIPAL